MIKLSGILEYSMGNFLCLRGFASLKLLSAVSKPKPEVQRDLIADHKGEMAAFLNTGEYRFFPEIILSTNLTDRINIAHISFDESKVEITRIDGNHRLSAANEVSTDFDIPFCLLLFRNPKENDQYSRALFHIINAKQIPLKL